MSFIFFLIKVQLLPDIYRNYMQGENIFVTPWQSIKIGSVHSA